ncbi:unnamed protein product, partial [Thlaspi arvense]
CPFFEVPPHYRYYALQLPSNGEYDLVGRGTCLHCLWRYPEVSKSSYFCPTPFAIFITPFAIFITLRGDASFWYEYDVQSTCSSGLVYIY